MSDLPKHYTFKYPEDMGDLLLIKPVLLYVFSMINIYCLSKGLPLQVTRVIGEKIPNVSISTSHAEGRAMDLSVKGWSLGEVDSFVDYFNEKFSWKYGAVSFSDGKARLIVYHFGTEKHIHVQCRKDVQ